MRLYNLLLLESGEVVDLLVEDCIIKSIQPAGKSSGDGNAIKFENAIVLPGLINSHEHLDFNLFPQLGDTTYESYVEWGKHLHEHYPDTIKSITDIPAHLRIQWGIYKNLLCGVTTVVNHGEMLDVADKLLTVHQQYNFIHSVQFEKKWRLKLNKPLYNSQPFVIHIGEGVNEAASNEIDQLIKWNLFNRSMVGVHGIAMTAQQAKHFDALVWCPVSNYFLMGRTAAIDQLKNNTRILFGTDSTLTSGWNIWDHARTAISSGMVSGNELYKMLTETAADTWQLKQKGKLAEGYVADLVVARSQPGNDRYAAIFNTNPADILLVMHKGSIQLFDASMKQQIMQAGIPMTDFFAIKIDGITKYVKGNLPRLMQQVWSYNSNVTFPVEIPS